MRTCGRTSCYQIVGGQFCVELRRIPANKLGTGVMPIGLNSLRDVKLVTLGYGSYIRRFPVRWA